MSNLVLIDTNAWITYFDPEYRGMPDVANEVERLIDGERACYTEIIYLELFVGIKSEGDVRKFKSAVAIHYGLELFHHDKRFLDMKKSLPLREYNFLQQ